MQHFMNKSAYSNIIYLLMDENDEDDNAIGLVKNEGIN